MDRTDRRPDAPLGMAIFASLVLSLSASGQVAAQDGAQASGLSTAARSATTQRDSSPERVDPDWAVLEGYLEAQRAWRDRMTEAVRPDVSDAESRRRRQRLQVECPDVGPAIAAATAIVDVGPRHDRFIDAAQFLFTGAGDAPNADQHMHRGALALIAQVPERWRRTLRSFARTKIFGQPGQELFPIQKFFEQAAFRADDPWTRAASRYFLANGYRSAVNRHRARLTGDAREALRLRAIDVASGLSAGVEDQELYGADDAFRSDWPGPRTFAQAEEDLLLGLRHATVGGTVSEMVGRRLDGAADRLSAYAGRAILLDFWATWCPPCIDALPQLRALLGELPADRFVLLAVSVDEDPATVTEFRKREWMPWINWHAGVADNSTRLWNIWSFPTYVLVDAEGKILARQSDLDEEFTSLVRAAVHTLP